MRQSGEIGGYELNLSCIVCSRGVVLGRAFLEGEEK